MHPTALLPRRLLAVAGLLLALTGPALARPVAALPTLASPSTDPPAEHWPVVAGQPPAGQPQGWAPQFGHALEQSRRQRAARWAYLSTEALDHGAYVSPAAEADRDTAAGMFDYLQSRNAFVDSLRAQDLTVLPVGLKKTLPGGNGTVEIGILKATFFPTHAELTVFARLEIATPDPNSSVKKRELFFGADHVRFTRDGGLSGEFSLVLLGDFVQPIGAMTLRLKGGLNRYTGATEQLTYARVSCEGLVGMGVAAEVLFARSMLVPIDGTTGAVRPEPERVMGRFRVDAPEFNDLIVPDISLTPFAVAGKEQFGFVLAGAKIDLSEFRNAPGVAFPANYFAAGPSAGPDPLPQGGADPTWKGVYVRTFGLLLPPQFRARNATNRVSIQANDLIFDRHGLTVRVSVTNPLPANQNKLSASGWNMSLDYFELVLEKSRLVGGRFAGGLTLPIASGTPVRYDGTIHANGDYSAELSNVKTLSMTHWRARADLAPESRVRLDVVNGVFKPSAVLHGRLGIATSLNGDTLANGQTFKFEGIEFENLVLQTESPYVKAGYFGYQKETKLANIPVSVQRIGVGFAGGVASLRLGLVVNLMEGAFGGEGDFSVEGRMVETDGIQEWKFERVRLSEICIHGSTKGGFELKGCAAFFENDPIYGNGFRGGVDFSMKKPVEVKVNITAQFGAKSTYRYWYVAGGATLPVKIPIAGPLKINYLFAAAYHHMKPTPLLLGSVQYVPNDSISIGFKAVAGLEAIDKKTFEGMAGFEMTFNRSGGINSIGFYGEGVLAGGFLKEQSGAARFGTMVKNEKAVASGEVTSMKELQSKATNVYKAGTDVGRGAILARIALLYDFTNNTLDGNAEAFVNIAGKVRGSGPNGLAGRVVMHFDPNEWYVHVGHSDPARRIGLIVDFGLQARTSAYFMVGHRIPNIPPPPREVTDLVGTTPQRSNADSDAIRLGQGVAFGAAINMEWDINLWVPYLYVKALAGTDVVLKQFPQPYCGRNTIGSNGWYARGQVYAFIQGEAGIRFFGKRRLISVSTAVLLEAGLPNPAWVSGSVAFHLSFVNVINETVRFNLSLGDECR